MTKLFSLLFYLKKPKNYQSGEVPVYARISVDRERAEFSTGRTILPEFWDQKNGRGIRTYPQLVELQAYLDSIKSRIYEIHRLMILGNEPIVAHVMKDKFTGKTEKDRTIVPVFEQHNAEVKALVGKDFAPGTLERYNTALSHLIEFMEFKYRIKDIELNKIDNAFLRDFEFYLKTERNCSHNTAMKYIANFKKIVLICFSNGWLRRNPFAHFKLRINEIDKIFLSEEEIELLINKKFRIARLEQIRDVFLFCCYTGLAYSDVKKLSPEHLSMGIDGVKWIYIKRTKTDVTARIPLLPIAEQILAKYSLNILCNHSGNLLPVLSNQKMNGYLKEIGELAGITKELTMHVARHTFATTVTLSNDVPIESVSKMLGHKNIRQTEHYAKVVDRKISNDMGKLRLKLQHEVPADKFRVG